MRKTLQAWRCSLARTRVKRSASQTRSSHRKRWSADSYRFATPGGHPGLQGSRASKFQKLRLRSLQKTQSEHEHASENEQEHNMERMRNEGRKHQNEQKCSQKGPGGHQIRAWRPPGRFWAPCGSKVGARSTPNGSWGRPGGAKQIVGWAPGAPRGEKLIDFRVPRGLWGGLRGGIFGVFSATRRGSYTNLKNIRNL